MEPAGGRIQWGQDPPSRLLGFCAAWGLVRSKSARKLYKNNELKVDFEKNFSGK